MSNKSINDVRTALFSVIDGLLDKQSPMDIERAEAVCGACQVLVNSAKVEVDFLKVSGGKSTGFIGQETPKTVKNGKAPETGIGTVTQHFLGH